MGSYDGGMGSLDFAFWDVIPHSSTGTAIADDYDAHIRLAQRLEALGWHSYFVIEHQNAPQGISSPSVYLTAVARETSRLRLGAMMWQLPFYTRCAWPRKSRCWTSSRAAASSSARASACTSTSSSAGASTTTSAPRSAKRSSQIVKMAWTQDEVTFDGKYFHFDEALPQPKPFQQPYPPIWAAVHSDTSVEFAARNNYHVAKNLDTDDVVARQVRPVPQGLARERARRADAAHLPDAHACTSRRPTSRRTTKRASIVATGARARRRRAHCPDAHRLGQPRARHGPRQRARRQQGARPDDGAGRARLRVQHRQRAGAGRQPRDGRFASCRRARQRMGYDLFCTNHQIGRMPRELVDRSIELFGKEVIPAFASGRLRRTRAFIVEGERRVAVGKSEEVRIHARDPGDRAADQRERPARVLAAKQHPYPDHELARADGDAQRVQDDVVRNQQDVPHKSANKQDRKETTAGLGRSINMSPGASKLKAG